MELSPYIDHIGYLSYSTKLKNDNDYKSRYVSDVCWRNANGRWYYGIQFASPESIDELIATLTYIRTVYKNQYDDMYEGIIRSIHRCENECKAENVEDGWKCEWCGEVTTSKYGDNGRPKRCSECGAFFNKYVEEGKQ